MVERNRMERRRLDAYAKARENRLKLEAKVKEENEMPMSYKDDLLRVLKDENISLKEENARLKTHINAMEYKKVNGEELARILMSAVNGGLDRKAFVKGVMNEHRTLQQLAFGLFAMCIQEWAKQEHWDLRNEDTIKASKEIVEKVDLGVRFI